MNKWIFLFGFINVLFLICTQEIKHNTEKTVELAQSSLDIENEQLSVAIYDVNVQNSMVIDALRGQHMIDKILASKDLNVTHYQDLLKTLEDSAHVYKGFYTDYNSGGYLNMFSLEVITQNIPKSLQYIHFLIDQKINHIDVKFSKLYISDLRNKMRRPCVYSIMDGNSLYISRYYAYRISRPNCDFVLLSKHSNHYGHIVMQNDKKFVII